MFSQGCCIMGFCCAYICHMQVAPIMDKGPLLPKLLMQSHPKAILCKCCYILQSYNISGLNSIYKCCYVFNISGLNSSFLLSLWQNDMPRWRTVYSLKSVSFLEYFSWTILRLPVAFLTVPLKSPQCGHSLQRLHLSSTRLNMASR